MTDSLATWLSHTGADLDEFLDVEGGLREILLHSDHEERVDDLDAILDEQAGLADILEPVSTPHAAPPPPPAVEPCRALPPALAAGHESLTPTERMRLRSTPALAKAVECLEFVQSVGAALSRNSRLATVTGGFQLLDMVASALAMLSNLYGPQEGHAHRDLSQAEAVLTAIAPSTRTNSEEADHPAFNQAASGALISALDLMDNTVRHTLLPTPMRAFTAPVAFQQLMHAGRLLDNVRRARNLLAHPTDAPLLQPASPHAHNEAESRTREVEQSCLRALQRTFEQRVGRRLPQLSTATLRLVLDDFTTADLSDADFQGVDMTGMRWSEHGTRWPATVDKDEIRKVSEEDPAGSGTYVIRFGTSASFLALAYTGQ